MLTPDIKPHGCLIGGFPFITFGGTPILNIQGFTNPGLTLYMCFYAPEIKETPTLLTANNGTFYLYKFPICNICGIMWV